MLAHWVCFYFLIYTSHVYANGVSPTITKRLASEKAIAIDGSGSLQCKAIGSPPLQVTWYRNGEKVISSKELPSTSFLVVSDGVLFFLKFSKNDEGVYHCNATNNYGFAVSNKVKVKAAFIEDFPVNPLDKISSIGETVLMECQTPEAYPKPDITWFKDDSLMKYNERVQLLENEILRIDKVNKNDAGSYYCKAKNTAGESISSKTKLSINQKPVLITPPMSVTVSVNEDARFFCEVSGDPKPTIVWRRENADIRDLGSRFLMEANSLIIKSVQFSDAGNYVCHARNSAGETEAISELIVRASPGFITTPEDKTVPSGSTAYFNCVPYGSPKPTFRWIFKNKTILPTIGGGTGRVKAYTDGRLQINSVRKSDEGVYQCLATSSSGQMKTSARLNVTLSSATLPPPMIILGPQNQTLREHNPVVFLPCDADSGSNTSNALIYWEKDGNNAVSSNSPRVSQLPSGTLQIKNLKMSDSGVYICRAQRDKKYDEWVGHLTVFKFNDRFQERKVDRIGLPEAPAEFRVVATGPTWFHFTWRDVSDSIRYLIKCAPQTPSGSWTKVYLGKPKENDLIRPKATDLMQEMGYFCYIRAENQFGWGPPSKLPKIMYTKAIYFSRSANTKSFPDINLDAFERKLRRRVEISDDIVLDSIGMNDVKVSWSVEGSYAKFITGFELMYKLVPLSRCLESNKGHQNNENVCSLRFEHKTFLDQQKSDFQSMMKVIDTAERTTDVTPQVDDLSRRPQVVIEGLRPFSCYEIDIEPFSDHPTWGRVKGQQSKSATVLTFDSKPSQAPENISAQWFGNTSIYIKWKPLHAQYRNGILLEYLIHLLGNTTFSRTLKADPNQDVIQVNNLVPELGYTIHIAGVTCRGEGVRSRPFYLPPLHPVSDKHADNSWFMSTIMIVVLLFLAWITICFSLFCYCRKKKIDAKNGGYSSGKLGSGMNLHPNGEQNGYNLSQQLRPVYPVHKVSPDTPAKPTHYSTTPLDLGFSNTATPYHTTAILDCLPHDLSMSHKGGIDQPLDNDWMIKSTSSGIQLSAVPRQQVTIGELIPPPPEYPPPPTPMSPVHTVQKSSNAYIWTDSALGNPLPQPIAPTVYLTNNGSAAFSRVHPYNYTMQLPSRLTTHQQAHCVDSLLDMMGEPEQHYITGQDPLPYLPNNNFADDSTLSSVDATQMMVGHPDRNTNCCNDAECDGHEAEDEDQESFISSASNSEELEDDEAESPRHSETRAFLPNGGLGFVHSIDSSGKFSSNNNGRILTDSVSSVAPIIS